MVGFFVVASFEAASFGSASSPPSEADPIEASISSGFSHSTLHFYSGVAGATSAHWTLCVPLGVRGLTPGRSGGRRGGRLRSSWLQG